MINTRQKYHWRTFATLYDPDAADEAGIPDLQHGHRQAIGSRAQAPRRGALPVVSRARCVDITGLRYPDVSSRGLDCCQRGLISTRVDETNPQFSQGFHTFREIQRNTISFRLTASD